MTLAQTAPRPDLSATTTLEIEIALTGTYSPYERQTRDHPGVDASVDDIEIEAFGLPRYVRDPTAVPGKNYSWKTFNMLDGVNVNSPDIQRLFANILNHIGDEAQDVLLAEVGE